MQERRTKLVPIAEAIAKIPDGAKVAIGGSLIRKAPMALIREIVRQKKKDLTLYSWSAGMDFDMLIGAGCVKEAWSSYVGMFNVGMAKNFRRAVEEHRIRFVDMSETCGMDKFRAAAFGLPFAISKTPLNSGLLKNPEFKEIICPFTGEKLIAMEAFHPDFAIVHAHRADKYGNVQFDTVRMMDNEMDLYIARCAGKSILSVEEIVPEEEIIRTPTMTMLPKLYVDSVCCAPCGAHPNSCDTRYDFDLEHSHLYQECSETEEGFQKYLDEYVYGTKDEEEYLKKVGGLESLRNRLGHGGEAE
ncbi:CoA-transferase [Clostridium sp. KNHs216]|uniref:CoA transferase subunit A n=1 Tax=Clostridium sp. KNHs216 TaxID=1550235 RepID=UPI00115146E1|nr:CoA-transferase [Clostridium sp. KNHs216]TQI66900.1 glutaconate CoA-transferase subunit A [Clostridium sp. KNHs216]